MQWIGAESSKGSSQQTCYLAEHGQGAIVSFEHVLCKYIDTLYIVDHFIVMGTVFIFLVGRHMLMTCT